MVKGVVDKSNIIGIICGIESMTIPQPNNGLLTNVLWYLKASDFGFKVVPTHIAQYNWVGDEA